MIKRGLKALILISIIATISFAFISFISCSFVTAQYETNMTKAIMWLESRTSDKDWSPTLTTERFVFPFLVLKDHISASSVETALDNFVKKGFKGECWSKPSCTLKETALAKLMLDKAGESTENIDEWLLNKTLPYTEVKWYLQLTASKAGVLRCLLEYEQEEIIINEKEEISGDPGTCFNISEKYWLALKPACTDKIFNITCNNSFIANFLFKTNSDWFVTEQSIGSKPADTNVYRLTIKPPIASCISQIGTECDYEATAWTAYAFVKAGQDEAVGKFKPYLVSEKDESESKKFLPEAFLYGITESPEWLNQLKAQQGKQVANLWLANNSVYNEFYDTALVGIMTDGEAGDWSAAKKALFKKQDRKGYWKILPGNFPKTDPTGIRETAMILLALEAVPEEPSECKIERYDCVKNCKALDGINHTEFDCPNGYECCDIPYGPNECKIKYGKCKIRCEENEQEIDYECLETTQKCCKEKSKLMCETELKGKKCSAGQKCINEDGFIIPYIQTADSNYCCLGTCIIPTQTCEELNGTICNGTGYSCDNKWLPATDTNLCCKADACKKELKTCIDMEGELCEDIQICKDGAFVIAKDTAGKETCCVSGGRCIYEKCPGESCAVDETCDGTPVEAEDAPKCCLDGDCLKSCSDLGGEPCPPARICEKPIKAGDITRCCAIGKCIEKRERFPFWLLILIIVIIALALVIFMFMRKKKKKKPKMMLPGMPPARMKPPRRGIFARRRPPARPPARRLGVPPAIPRPPAPPRPPGKPAAKPMPAIKPAFPIKPLAKAAVKLPAKPKPSAKPPVKPKAKPKPKAKRKAVLEELEKISKE